MAKKNKNPFAHLKVRKGFYDLSVPSCFSPDRDVMISRLVDLRCLLIDFIADYRHVLSVSSRRRYLNVVLEVEWTLARCGCDVKGDLI